MDTVEVKFIRLFILVLVHSARDDGQLESR